MSQYRSTGGLDDAIASDGDKAFNSVNLRDQLNQLLPTEVRESVNGRMEGYWKPRKSVYSRTGALVSGGNPLQLPFLIVGTSIAIATATRNGNTVTLTTGAAHGLTAGSRLSIEGIGYTLGTDPNGLFVAVSASGTSITYTVTGADGSYTTSAISVLTTTSKKISAAAVGSGLVTITIFEAHGLATGDFVSIQDVVFTTGANPNGKFQITVTNATQFTYALALGAGSYTVVNALANKLSTAITAVVYNSNLVTLTVAAHGVVVGQTGNAIINGIVFTGVDYNGVVSLTAATSTTFTFVTAGVTAVAMGTTPRVTQILVNDSAAGNVRASCLFSNPNEQSKEYVIVALDTVAKKIDLDTYAVTTINYPPTQTVDTFTDMIQVFDKVMLFRDGKQALEWYPNGRPVISASSNATASPNTVVTMNVREHGLLVGSSITIAGLTNGTPPDGTYVVNTVTSKDTFTFLASGISTGTTFVTTVATASDGFSLSPGGAYTQPQVFNVPSSDVSVSGGLVTVNRATLANTTIAANDIIVIYETTIPEFAEVVGKEFQVVSATTTIITFYAPIGNLSAGGAHQLQFGGRFTVGGGFMHQPGAPWGIHFQRRLWVPYYYDQSGAYNGPTYVNRKIVDEIAVSDILDTTTFDQIESQFRITGGTADSVVAMHGFYNDSLVVLNRNSLHLIQESKGGLLDVTVKELTSEIGCLARKTVLMRGNTMYFLSDNGVYGLEFLNDYNLRGMDQPLSKNIQPYIDRINPDKADKAVAVYFDNRYFLAVPLDSVAGANDAIGNNAVLVYNFLNKGWESIDTYGDSQFVITDYIKASGGVRDNLYAITSNGGLHQMEFAESINDRLSVSNLDNTIVTPQIAASLTSRGYNFASLERKRFTDTQIQMQNLAGETGEYNISFAAEDPDFATAIGTTSTFLGGMLTPTTANEAETATIRCRIGGVRGFTGTLILNRTQGSPKIHSIMVAGSVTNRQIISQK